MDRVDWLADWQIGYCANCPNELKLTGEIAMNKYTRVCEHGWVGHCNECDEDIDIDKCLNCGKYKASNQLNEDQVCIAGCINPAEY